MNVETWKRHIEEEGIICPSRGGDRRTWKETIKAHRQNKCVQCKSRRHTRMSEINALFGS